MLPGTRTKSLPGLRQASQAPLTGTALAHLTTLLKPNFLPSSMSQPPTASSNNTGNRVIAVTTKTQNQPKLTDSAVLALVAGTLTWSFKTNFTVPPAVTATPQGAGGGATLYISSVASNEVIINSSSGTDTRTVHLQAVQPAQGD